MLESSCFDQYHFLALDYCTGLEDSPYIDGIFGLSPDKGREYEEHALPMMKASGMIDEASVAFSIATL